MKVKLPILLISVVIVLISCAGQPESVTRDTKVYSIESDYTLETLLNPIKQLNDVMKYFDYFDQFVFDNDYNYSNFLFNFFLLESFNGPDGTGSRFVSFAGNREAVFTFDKTLLSTEPDGKQWWQLSILYQDRLVFFEVLIHEMKVPIKFRYIDRDTGEKHELIPAIGEQFLNELNNISREDLEATIAMRKKEAMNLDRP